MVQGMQQLVRYTRVHEIVGDVTWVGQGNLTLKEPVARIRTSEGAEREVTMVQRWPVRRPIPGSLLRRGIVTRLYAEQPLTTGTRIIGPFFPIACGGTGCIPGPFGAGKTVLQSTLARYSSVDIVVVVACGERAGEVVETITLYLQQDAFDEVDACMPRDRQLESLRLMKSLIDREYHFKDRDEARDFFTKLIGLYKNWNYSPLGSPDYEKYKHQIEEAARQEAFGVA